MTTLTKNQTKTFRREYDGETIVATVRHGDRCGNGHNTFSITGDVYKAGRLESCGCIHDEIAEHFPELAPLIKWHLCSTDGPMHYVANTVYHADEHGPTHAWIYYIGPSDPLGIGKPGKRLIGYFKTTEAKRAEGQDDYRVEWDEATAKTRDLDAARNAAVWPDATDEELTAPDLETRLRERLPGLLAEFRTAVESLGFVY